ncbi:T9SS type A sorting domain-containing protein [Desertivirga arenae]|uniref:T9SS type A sorting domain-containing protein n=1 Tax=Desertivirga arenae TaxID=2810309 RepID=UPI001A96B7A7|nr:T9SS type A sorting domain-containing protein [Pedobacter sp. SYSU D00823]
MRKTSIDQFVNTCKSLGIQIRRLAIASAMLLGPPVLGQQLAFPSAEGFGRFATGGRGGTVYKVTNLNDSGPGSFRDAVSQPNRTVVFTVGGIIRISTRISVQKNITIAGQTAPGDGIMIYGNGLSFTNADNSVVRYIRIRMGINGDDGKDAIAIANGKNMIFDHVSVSWGRDGTLDVSAATGDEVGDMTFQNCIIAQGLQGHSTGGLLQTDGGISILRSLYIDNNSRNPKVKGINQFVNNVIYNWVASAYILGDSDGASAANVTNNYFINGPETSTSAFSRGNTNFSIYAANNYQDSNKDGVLNGSVIPQSGYGTVTWKTTPFDYPAVTELTPQAALNYVIANAGYNKKRDKTDARLITELQSYGTIGQTISDENNAPMNGVGTLNSGSAPYDADNDGMPDSWESANGTNINVADNNGDLDADGYTNLEEYLNSLTGGDSATGTSITIQENSTGFCSVQGTIDSDHSGFTGSGFANTNNAANAGIVWRINVPAAGLYTLAWRQANGTGDNRVARLLVNGSEVLENINFPSTGSWTTWKEVSVTRLLAAGQNTLRFESTTASGLSNIDYLKVTGNNPSVLSCAGATVMAAKGHELSLIEPNNSSSIIYPNPSIDKFTIKSADKFSYYVYDQLGKELERGQAKEQVSTGSNLASGVYFIKIVKASGAETLKFIKQ